MTISAARVLILSVLDWPEADMLTVAAVLALGRPSELHAGFPAVPCERDEDPGGAPAARRLGGEADSVRADALHLYRTAARQAGCPLPVPGQQAGVPHAPPRPHHEAIAPELP